MSGCWCKCEAGVGRCGPKVPRLKSLFGSHEQTDEASFRRGDRQAELQIIWDALEEGVRRRTALEENVMNSEERLAEILGPGSAKVIVSGDVDMDFMLSWLSTQEVFQSRACTPSQLRLQTGSDENMLRLHELDAERLGAYRWVGGLVVMLELRHRVMLLRETLNLPPCDPFADLDKDGQGLVDQVERAAQLRLRYIQEKRNVRKRTRDVPRQKSESPLSCGTSNSGPESNLQISKNKITRQIAPSSEASHSFELLSQHLIKMLDTLNQQLRLTVRTTEESTSSSNSSSETATKCLRDTVKIREKSTPSNRSTPELLQARDSSPMSLHGKIVRTPASVRTRAANPSTCCSSGMMAEGEVRHPAETLGEVAGVPRSDLSPCTATETQDLAKIKPPELFGARTSSPSIAKASARASAREPLRLLPNCACVSSTNSGSKALKKPGQQPPPPPPPPMPPSASGQLLLREQSSKMKRSVKIGRLYRNLKRKIEGASQVQPTMGAGSSSRRLSRSGSREGMAEALAEITKKSTYFQKIEGDVQQFHDSIEESKLALEDFETADMEQLLRFHKTLESILEKLTDETQVLARFKGFPSNKLETVRLAAALYSRLLSMAQELERWEVQAPASEHLGKVTRYFEKIKKDLEVVEGSKDEDMKRFTSQKINFDFSILGRIKEAMVGLSSRCLVQALEESKKSKEAGSTGMKRVQSYDPKCQKLCSQVLWRAFQLAYRVYNFAGGHDDQSERLISDVATEIDSFPPEIWT